MRLEGARLAGDSRTGGDSRRALLAEDSEAGGESRRACLAEDSRRSKVGAGGESRRGICKKKNLLVRFG